MSNGHPLWVSLKPRPFQPPRLRHRHIPMGPDFDPVFIHFSPKPIKSIPSRNGKIWARRAACA